MREIVEILMRRDGISESEALDIINQCQEEIDCAIGEGTSYDEVEEIFASWTGLESDYLIKLL